MATEVFILFLSSGTECNYSNSPVICGTGKGARGGKNTARAVLDCASMQPAKRGYRSGEIVHGEGDTIMGQGTSGLRGLSLMILSASLNMPSRAQEKQASNLQTSMPGLNLMPVP